MVKKIVSVFTSISVIAVGILFGMNSCCSSEYEYDRSHLDKYVEVTTQSKVLGDGADVYFDMSNGMNFAYADNNSKTVLQNIVNGVAGNNAIKYFGLANNEITSIEKSHTDLYNYLLNPSSYSQTSAPLQKTLEEIVSKNRPALLLTDYEEYNGGVIQNAAYAKETFINWLKAGNTITFYKWNFVENGKSKLMFLTVFDDNINRLGGIVENAVRGMNLEKFVLGGKDFGFPVMTKYNSSTQGGNYHNSKGQDIVTVVLEKGDNLSYKCYSESLASAGGNGAYTPLNICVGARAEYYPIAESWENVLKNIEAMSDPALKNDRYQHLLTNLYLNFEAQNGYKVDGIEARVFDITEAVKKCAAEKIDVEVVQKESGVEIFDFLVATTQKEENLDKISIDFDPKFTATKKFAGAVYRVDIVISKTSALIDNAKVYFSWEGNPSLANSVEQVLLDADCNPKGRVLYTYYIKNLAY